jgi:type II secretory pathway component GspD/PulD (secretin)
MTHTPAPWREGRRYGNNRTEVLSSTGGRAIATVWTHERRDMAKQPDSDSDYVAIPEGIENLNLVIAAPELLEALEQLLVDDQPSESASCRRNARDYARKVIARVKAGAA